MQLLLLLLLHVVVVWVMPRVWAADAREHKQDGPAL
jgi:hypothetical protein